MCRQFPFISKCWVAAPGGRQFEFNNEEERREAIDHIREMARRKYLGEREVGEEPMGGDGRMGTFGSLWRGKNRKKAIYLPFDSGGAMWSQG